MREIRAIKEKYKNDFLYTRSGEGCENLLAPADIDGAYYFTDIDYSDESRGAWKPSAHYSRILTLLCVGGEKRLREDEAFRERMIGALRFWLIKDLRCPNWWYNQISAASCIASISLLLEPYLDGEMRAGVERILLWGSFKAHLVLGIEDYSHIASGGFLKTPADKWTGANLIWAAVTTIKHALLNEDEELLRLCVTTIEGELCYSKEGIQPDGAFCQHGRRWYSGGYGRSFVSELAPVINLLGGTSYAISDEKIEILLSHVLDGQRMMHRNGYFDYSAVGREYTRKGAISSGSLLPAVRLLAKTDGIARSDELLDFCRAISGEGDNHRGTVYYESIAQLCHKRQGVYIGVRGRGEGILGAEHCNAEGLLSYNMTYGTVTCVMETGREYCDVAPVWDYSRIPGTTARDESDEQLLSHEGWSYNLETDCRVIGYSDGECGVLSERAVHDGISLLATYFVYDGKMVALGTDINDERGEVLHTTVEQCLAREASVGHNNVKRGNITYKNLDSSSDFVTELGEKSGDWLRNKGGGAAPQITNSMLTITLPIRSGDRYAYLVCEGEVPEVEVLLNSSVCQAIILDGIIMAAFHGDATIEVGQAKISGHAGEIIVERIKDVKL